MASRTFAQDLIVRSPLMWFMSSYAIITLFIIALLLVIYVRRRSNGRTPPTIPGHWFFKNQLLLQAPWRGILLAEKYKPQYGADLRAVFHFGSL